MDIQIAHTFTSLKIPFEFLNFWDVETYFDFVSYHTSQAKQATGGKVAGIETTTTVLTPDEMENF